MMKAKSLLKVWGKAGISSLKSNACGLLQQGIEYLQGEEKSLDARIAEGERAKNIQLMMGKYDGMEEEKYQTLQSYRMLLESMLQVQQDGSIRMSKENLILFNSICMKKNFLPDVKILKGDLTGKPFIIKDSSGEEHGYLAMNFNGQVEVRTLGW